MNGRRVTTLSNRIHGPLLAFAAIIVSLGTGYAIVRQSLSSLAIVLAFCGAALLSAFLARPDFIVPALIITIPLEISKLFFPFFLVEKTLDGKPVSVVELWRIGLVLGAMAFVLLMVSAGKNRKSILVLRHPIILSSVSFFVFCVVQAALVSPDRSRGLLESARLGAHVFLLIMTVGLLSSVKRIELALKSFVYSMFVLVLLGIYQYFSGQFFWNLDLADWGGVE